MPISLLISGVSILLLPFVAKDGKMKSNRVYYFICMVLLALAYIRNPMVGTDAINNYNAFYNLSSEAVLDYGSGYLLYVKLIQLITLNYRFFLIVTSTAILFPFFYVLKEKEYRSFALILFFLSMYAATYDVIKGYLSFSFIFISVFYWNKGKVKKAVFWGVIGVLFHPSILLLILFLWAANHNIDKRRWILIYFWGVVFLIPTIQDLSTKLLGEIGSLVSSRYAGYTFSENYFSTTYVLLYGFASVFLAMYYRKLLQEESERKENLFYINMHLIGQWLSLFGGFIPHVNRYMKFILIFSIILICKCLKTSQNVVNMRIIKFVSLFAYAVFVFLNNGGTVYTVGG